MTDQPPPLPAAALLARLEEQQAEVDDRQAAYDAATVKSRKAHDVASRAYSALESAKERRDALHARLLAALPSPDPEPEPEMFDARSR